MKTVNIQVVESKELEIPTKVSELENDLPEEQDYATKQYVDEGIESIEVPSVPTSGFVKHFPLTSTELRNLKPKQNV